MPAGNRRKLRNSALLLGAFAFAVYAGFIIWSITKQRCIRRTHSHRRIRIAAWR